MIRFCTSMNNDLYALLQSRAELNRRSINKEVIYLLEAALAAEHDGNLDILRALMISQGGVASISPQPS